MSPFVNGAISALDKLLRDIEKIDPSAENTQLNFLKEEIRVYKDFYLKCEDFSKIEDLT